MWDDLNYTGLIFAGITLITIGLGFLWVIKLEYYAGARVAKLIGVLGVAVCVMSVFMPGFFFSSVVGIIAGTIFWGATELPDQAERVKRGLFRANPARAASKEVE